MNLFRRSAESFLPDRDYLPIAMPTTDLGVFYVLAGERGVLRRYSTLDTVLSATDGSPLPTVTRDAVVAAASGSMTKSTKLGLGIGAVSSIARALGANGDLHLSATNARTIQYGYSDVVADRVDLVELDRWLAAADFNPTARATADLLAADACHVVVAALKAHALDVTVLDEHGHAVKLDVSMLQEAVGLEVGIGMSSTSTGTLVFRGTAPLTVAAKVVTIKLDEHGFTMNNRAVNSRTEIRGAGALSGSSDGAYTFLREPDLRFALR